MLEVSVWECIWRKERQRHLEVKGWTEQEKEQGRGLRLGLEKVWLVELDKNQVPPWTRDQRER